MLVFKRLLTFTAAASQPYYAPVLSPLEQSKDLQTAGCMLVAHTFNSLDPAQLEVSYDRTMSEILYSPST